MTMDIGINIVIATSQEEIDAFIGIMKFDKVMAFSLLETMPDPSAVYTLICTDKKKVGNLVDMLRIKNGMFISDDTRLNIGSEFDWVIRQHLPPKSSHGSTLTAVNHQIPAEKEDPYESLGYSRSR